MNTSTPAGIDSRDLHELLDSGMPPLLIDVRTPTEFEAVHIRGAYNVPLDLLREHCDEMFSWVHVSGLTPLTAIS